MAFSFYLIDMLNRHFFMGETLNSPIATPYGTGTYLGIAAGYPVAEVSDTWIEVTGNAYARQSLSLLYDEVNFLLRQSADVQFPSPSPSGWGTAIGLLIYNNSSGEHVLFDLPWWQTSTGPKVASYTIGAGEAPYFLAESTDIKLSIHGKEPASPSITTNGGISTTYAGVISKWIINTAPVPYARTYNVAIGSNLIVDAHGRFAGVWQECSGNGYQRVAIPSDGWYNYPTAVRNINEIVFPTALGTWGPVTYVVLYPTDAPEVPAFWGYLETAANIVTGNVFTIGPSSLTISWEGDYI